jgi:uncharacterized membrane protein
MVTVLFIMHHHLAKDPRMDVLPHVLAAGPAPTPAPTTTTGFDFTGLKDFILSGPVLVILVAVAISIFILARSGKLSKTIAVTGGVLVGLVVLGVGLSGAQSISSVATALSGIAFGWIPGFGG